MPLKGLSFKEIVKKEMAEGKPQAQAVAIAYKTTGKNSLTWREKLNTLEERTARGTERYAAKPIRYGEDEASTEAHQEQYAEIVRKKA